MFPFCGNCLNPGYTADFFAALSVSYFPQKGLRSLDSPLSTNHVYCSKCSSGLIVEVAAINPGSLFPITTFEAPLDKKPETIQEFAKLIKNYLERGFVLARGFEIIDSTIETLIRFQLENTPDSPIVDEEELPWIPENIDYFAFCPKCYEAPLVSVSGTKKIDMFKKIRAVRVKEIRVECHACKAEPVWFKIDFEDKELSLTFLDRLPKILEGPYRVTLLPMGNTYYSVVEDYPHPFDTEKAMEKIKNVLKAEIKLMKPYKRLATP